MRFDDARIETSGAGSVSELLGTTSISDSPVGTMVTIGATGGDGVSLRSGCSVDARIAGGWRDGAEGVVVEVGLDECADWTRVKVEGVGSWVSDQYLLGLGEGRPAPAEEVEALKSLPEAVSVGAWIVALDEASSRMALIARTATGNSMPHETDFLFVIEGELGVLRTSMVESPLAGSGSLCGVAAGKLDDAAVTLRSAAVWLAALFEQWPAASYPYEIDRLASQYASLAAEAKTASIACLDTA